MEQHWRDAKQGGMLQWGEIKEKKGTIEKMKAQTDKLTDDSIYYKSKATELHKP